MHTIRALSWKRLTSMGWDGFATLLISMLVLLFSGGISFLICWAVVMKYARRPAGDVQAADVILVLGSRLNRGEITPEFEARLHTAASRPERHPVIVLGGMASPCGRTEAGTGYDWLVGEGVEPYRILKEEESRNTLENLVQARDLMKGNGFRHALLVTSRYHIARAAIIARGLNLSHDLFPADFPRMWHPAAFARSLFEALMINWYYAGNMVAQLTGHKGLLARIN
jgi:uncharacterized SAM-binding protein YcdF (DUF218 family)